MNADNEAGGNIMILMTARIIRLLVVFGAFFAGAYFFRGQLQKKGLTCLGVSLILLAVVAGGIAEMLPPLTEEVTLTALGEKRTEAEKEEVYLEGYTIDGKAYSSGKDLKITAGKWFWSGETYAWRIESDPRQPQGTTRSITVQIPVGWERALNFKGDVWRGMVEISIGEKTWVVDTFSENSRTVSVAVDRSRTPLLIKNQICYLVVYFALFTIMTVILFCAVNRWDKIRRWNQRHRGIAMFALIALAQFVVAVRYSGMNCFWNDELYEIGWSEEATSILNCLFIDNAPLPIFRCIFHLWYSIAPYGERWLLLFVEVATAIGVFLIGLCGKEWKNVRVGVFAALFALVSGTVLRQCSYEIRSYGFYFASSALVLYLYLRSWKTPKSRSATIWFTLAMVFFAGMHYHAVIFCIALFIIDVFAFFCFGIKRGSIIPYIVAAMSYIPNIVYVLKTKYMQNLVTESWQPVAGAKEVGTLLSYLAGESKVVLGLFLLGTAIIVALLLERQKAREQWNGPEVIWEVTPLIIPCFVITFFVIYGNFVNRRTTLWHNRYFCDLIPCVLIICGFALDCVCEFCENSSSRKFFTSATVCLFSCMLILPPSLMDAIKSGTSTGQPFRGAADWLYSQSNDIYNNETLILTSIVNAPTKGWEHYYLTRQGRRDAVQVLPSELVSVEDLRSYQKIYLMTLHISTIRGELADCLSTEYECIGSKPEYKITVYQRK